MKDLLEVCPLSRGVMFQPLSCRLPTSLRFFQIPLPAVLSASLTGRFPRGTLRAYHVPRCSHERFRYALFTGRIVVHDRGDTRPLYPLPAFWLKLISTFSLLKFTMFIERSHLLTLPSTLDPAHVMLMRPSFPHGCDGSLTAVGALSEGFLRFVALPQYLLEYC